MLTPALRQDLKLFPGTTMEDGSPSWLLYDQLRNKYFTLGISAFRMVKNWIAGIDSKEFLKKIHEKGLDIEENQLNDFINFLQTNSLVIHSKSEDIKILLKHHSSQQKHWLLKLIHNYLFFKIPLIKPDPFLDKTLGLAKSLSGPFVRYVIYCSRMATLKSLSFKSLIRLISSSLKSRFSLSPNHSVYGSSPITTTAILSELETISDPSSL